MQHRLQSTLHRMMNDRCNYEHFGRMTQFRVRLHHLANRYVLNSEKLDLHLEPSRRDLIISEIQSLQTFGTRFIERTLRMEEEARKAAWIIHKKVCNIPGLVDILRIDMESSNRVQQAMFLHHENVEREKFIVDSGASLHDE